VLGSTSAGDALRRAFFAHRKRVEATSRDCEAQLDKKKSEAEHVSSGRHWSFEKVRFSSLSSS
jgi:hypothetical protein